MTATFEEGETLRLYYDGVLLFSDGGSWLHPLFDLEEWLKRVAVDPGRLFLVDTVTGKAAACLVSRMKIRAVYAGIMSRLAADLFDRLGIDYRAGRLVDRIACKTEALLETVDDAEAAYRMLLERAGRSR